MSHFFHNNKGNQTKRESKPHQKKVTTNSFNEHFTIYANVVNSNLSQELATPSKVSHQKIQAMKDTLRSQHDHKS